MSQKPHPTVGDVVPHLNMPHLDGCICTHKWARYGRLYGVDMGEGPVLHSVHPNCPVHQRKKP